jgi:L-fuconolactonase
MRIDAHQHFWHFDPVRDAWITDDMSVIRRDFLPADLQPLLQANGFDGCVAVQADQSDAETDFLLDLASRHDFIKGVVGWTDLRARDLGKSLEQWSAAKKLKGFRHILQAERPEYMLSPEFVRGLGAIGELGYTYDILVFPSHLETVEKLLEHFDNQYFVVDHIAKPYIRSGEIREWERDIRRVASFPNVYCKVSGLVTEASLTDWKPGDIFPYLEVVLDAFGPGRLMYGSDWPVCLLAASYERQLEVVESFFSRLSPGERERITGLNAIDFYQLF